MGQELLFLSKTKETEARQQAKHLPPRTLVLHSYRFSDNMVGVIRGKIGLTRVQSWFEFLYDLDLQQEGEGLVLPSLEASISLHEGKVGLRLKVKLNLDDTSDKLIVRFPDPHSVNAKEIVKSLRPKM